MNSFYKNRHKIKRAFILFSGLAITYLLITSFVLYGKENVEEVKAKQVFSEGWQIYTDNVLEEENATLPYYVTNKESHIIELYNTIPQTAYGHTAIDFLVYQKNVWVYVENELIYEHVFTPTWFNKKFPGSGRCVVMLPKESEGKEIQIRLEKVVPSDDASIAKVTLMNGTIGADTRTRGETIAFTLAAALLFIGILLMLITLLYQKIGLHLMPLLYLAITILSIGSWILCNSKLIEAYTHNWVFMHYLEYISFYLIPIGLLSFVRSNWKKPSKTICIMENVMFVYFNITIIAKIFLGIDFYTFLRFFHFLVLGGILVIVKEVITKYKQRSYSYKIFTVGAVAAVICSIVELFRYYSETATYSIAIVFILGIVILSICLIFSFLLGVKEQLEQSFALFTRKNLETEHKRYEMLISNTHDIFMDWNLLNDSVYFSKQFEAYFGIKPFEKELLKMVQESLERVSYSTDIFELHNRMLKGSQEEVIVGKFQSDKEKWFQATITAMFDNEQKPMRIIAIIKDITKEKELEKEFANQNEQIQINRGMYDNILEADITEDRVIGETGEVLAKALGMEGDYSYERIIDAITKQLTHEDFKEEYAERLSRERILSLYESDIFHFTYECVEKDGNMEYKWIRLDVRIFKSEITNTIRIISYVKSIEEEKKKEFELLHSSQRDSLTGLLHKGATKQKITEFLVGEGKFSQSAFMMIDVDNFKNVNDTMGHAVGDLVIQDNAQLLRTHFRDSDIIGRIGGDEFAVLIKNVPDKRVLIQKCEELCQAFHYIYEYEDKKCNISISVGVCLYPDSGITYDELYQIADKALYESKEKGRNTYTFAKKEELL